MNRIIGIGVDIVEISRVKRMLDQYGERFLSRVFTEAEAKYSLSVANAAERLAGRFAVKEAAIKALGTGKTSGISLRNIETVHDSTGKPVVRLSGSAARILKSKGGGPVHASISHDGGKAVAFVVMERQMEDAR